MLGSAADVSELLASVGCAGWLSRAAPEVCDTFSSGDSIIAWSSSEISLWISMSTKGYAQRQRKSPLMCAGDYPDLSDLGYLVRLIM